MAELNTDESPGRGHKKGKQRAKKSSTKIDMTPMVDLAFLLLTFFMLTTTFSKPKVMELSMPANQKEEEKRDEPKINNALTLIVDQQEKIFWYEGAFKKEVDWQQTSLSPTGIRKLFLEKNSWAKNQLKTLKENNQKNQLPDSVYKKNSLSIKGDQKALTVLIKVTENATYEDVVRVLDELAITQVGKYIIVEMSAEEKKYLAKMLASQ